GVGWAASLYSDLVGRWKKRNNAAMSNYDPANLDVQLYWDLQRRYGGKMVEGRIDTDQDRKKALYSGNPFAGSQQEVSEAVDEFERCGITRPEDLRERFEPNFYFGC